MVKKAHVARNKLDKLGMFKSIDIFIDTSKGNTSYPGHIYKSISYEMFLLTVMQNFYNEVAKSLYEQLSQFSIQ